MALLGFVGIAAAACGSGVGAGGAAIELGSESLARSDVQDFAGMFGTLGAPADTPAAEVTPASIGSSLEFWAVSAAIEQELGDNITDAHREGAKMWAESQFPQVAEDTPLFERLQGYWASRLSIPEQELRDQLVAVNAEQGEQVCASHILVDTEEEANELISRIESGEDFAQVAAQFSTDTGSGANGGSLGCAARGQYVPEFEDAVWNGTDGELIGPVGTQFGFHVILHQGFTEGGFVFEEVEEELRNLVFDERIGAAILAANVQLDPRYGEWSSDDARVVLPAGAETELPDLEGLTDEGLTE